jgi:hypothetical protein
MEWLQNKVRNIRDTKSLVAGIVRETDRGRGRFITGGLYCFSYDPKHSGTLPYYDAFPLVLVLEKYSDGFLGLNLHYLPIRVRAAFLDLLLDYASYNDNDEVRRIRVTYSILSSSKRFKSFGPCLKRYLYNYTTSKILKIEPHEWETALFLPTEQFHKATKRKVHTESMQQITKV